MATYITETWLRERNTLADGTELHLPAGACLTPAAQSLVSERHLRVKYVDASGQVFVNDPAAAHGKGSTDERRRVHPLTGSDHAHAMHCVLCRQAVDKKPDTLTHLNADTLVSKNDPRIHLRGQIDDAIACAVWIQAELAGSDKPSRRIAPWLADVRSGLGNVLRAEATGDALHPVHMGGFDAEAIHRMSHAPLKHLGYDHIVPDVEHGLTAARLNMLRTAIRKVELVAARLYIGGDFSIARPDILEGLNRLSSAVYVLMIVALMLDRGLAVKEAAWS